MDSRDHGAQNDSESCERHQSDDYTSSDVLYKVDDTPPWYLCFFLGFQHYVTMFGGTFMYPYIITSKMCMRDDDPSRGYIISTTFLVSGIATLLQSTYGIRLPIVQGCTYAFMAPTLAILDLPQWQCTMQRNISTDEGMDVSSTKDGMPVTGRMNSSSALSETNAEEWNEAWRPRMREIQGAVVVACLVEVVIGMTGIVGFLLSWVTPLAIVPTVTLVGLSLIDVAADTSKGNWAVAAMSVLLLALFSQYLRNVRCPLCMFSRLHRCHIRWMPIFKIFPVLLTILIAWILCGLLTLTNALPEDDPARTDLRLQILKDTPWFRFPYPGQWGLPTVSAGAVCGLLAGVLASSIESIGDYYACARLSGAPPPPSHAINRGIMMEGLGCILAGLWGSGSGLTSYSENVGAIGLTKVGSRRVIQYGAIIMIAFGLIGKAGALFITIPQPIVGGIFFVMFSVIAAVGLSNLYLVNLSSSRNHFVLGVSLFFGMSIPRYLRRKPGIVKTGSSIADQILTVVLSTDMFVGCLTGLVLDNTIPGSDEERGLKKWRMLHQEKSAISEERKSSRCYDFPYGMSFLEKNRIFSYLPISPTYREGIWIEKARHVRMQRRAVIESTDVTSV